MDRNTAIAVISILAVLVVLVGAGCFVLASFLVRRKARMAKTDADSIVRAAKEEAAHTLSQADEAAASVAQKSKDAADMSLNKARMEADNIRTSAQNSAQKIQLDAKSQADEIRAQARAAGDDYLEQKRNEVAQAQRKLDERDNQLDRRDAALDEREKNLSNLSAQIADQKSQLDQKVKQVADRETQIEAELTRVASLSMEEARKEVMAAAESRSAMEVAEYLKTQRDDAEYRAEEEAKTILANAIERYSQDVAIDRTTTTVKLPNDDIKGMIIGREGRNIKSLESILGVDILVDDTPEVLSVSCFNPIRREVAVRTLQILIKDGRIQPGKIEDTYNRVEADLDSEIKKTGEEVVMKMGLPRINKDLCYYIGRLKFRTSFTQNALDHCIQVGQLAGAMAAELGLDQTLAKRCGLLHDIGKAADFEVEGSHVEIGVRLAKKYGEPPEVISAIASHHGDAPKKYIYDELVVAADTLSAARPGARSETMENYIKRVQGIEDICKSYAGVANCYALQSGRDVRVMVMPDKVDDKQIILLAQQIRDRIQNEMTYPGNIKITVIRENRAIEIAR